MSDMKSTARVLVVPYVEGKFPSTAGRSILRGFFIILLVVATGLVNHLWNRPAFAQGQQSGMHWVGSWSTPPQAQGAGQANGTTNAPSNAVSFNNQTLRMV